MGKKVRFITEVQKAFDKITDGVRDLNEIAYLCEEEGFRNKLIAYVAQYAHLNYDMSTYLIMKVVEAVKADKDEDDFNKLMESLE